MKPHVTFFMILSLNTKLFSGGPCTKEEHSSGWKGNPGMCRSVPLWATVT